MTPTDPEFFDLQRALLGRFSIERELGRGGMGIVYLARDVQLERSVAIKLLVPALASSEMRRRFLREARLAAQCFHPHIVPIHAVEEGNGLAWIVMAYVRGETLAERVRRAGPLDAAALVRLAQDIGWALSYAHQRGLVHRDVKPENILIDAASERYLMADFGIARNQSDESPLISGASAAGTPRYMAPEQAAGEVIDGRADLYALGGTLFFASTGRAPFVANNHVALAVKHASVAAASLRAVAPSLPTALADAIDRCLYKVPDDRFPSAEAFVEFISPRESERSLPPSLEPVRANANGAKAMLGWAASIGITTALLALGESPHSFGRDIIAGIGGSLSAFLGALSAFRTVEAFLSAQRALRNGLADEDIARALSSDVSREPTEGASRASSVLLVVAGATLALLQGHLAHAHDVPQIMNDLTQIGLLFAPAYLIGRGAVGVTRNTGLRQWLCDHIEQPFARAATSFARRFVPGRTRGLASASPEDATELRLGQAVHDAFLRLPQQKQRLLGDVEAAARALTRDAERLRAQNADLLSAERAARVLDSDAGRVQLLDKLQADRQHVQQRLKSAVAALESLRLDLLRADSDSQNEGGLTTHIEAVRDLGRQVDAAAELRAYLARSNPTPA